MPALRDGNVALFESGAILHYLAEKYGLFLPKDPAAKWDAMCWLHWQMANVGPMFGNRLSYVRYLTPDHEGEFNHPQKRFGDEARRLAEVLDERLEGREYVCNEYTIVDMAIYPWLRGWKWSKVDLTGDRTGKARLGNVLAWLDRVRARPGVDAGLRWGMGDEANIDTWSKETREKYKSMGGTIATAHGKSKL